MMYSMAGIIMIVSQAISQSVGKIVALPLVLMGVWMKCVYVGLKCMPLLCYLHALIIDTAVCSLANVLICTDRVEGCMTY